VLAFDDDVFDDVVADYGLGMSDRQWHMPIFSFPIQYFSWSHPRVLFLVWLLYFSLMRLFLEIKKAKHFRYRPELA
jgi:hypothetical protein